MELQNKYADDHFKYPAFARHRDNAPLYWSDDIIWAMLATSQETNGVFSVMELLCTDKSVSNWHYHALQDETFYVLEGSVDFFVGGKKMEAKAGAFISIPKGTAHRFAVTSPSAKVLNSYYPGGFEKLVMGIGQPIPSLSLSPIDLPPPDLAKGKQLAEEQGLVLLSEEITPVYAHSPKPFMVYANGVQGYWAVGILWSIMAKYEQTDGNHSFIDELIPQGPAAPPHRHEAAEEIFYIVDGEATFFAGKALTPIKAVAGTLVVIPKGTTHAFQIDSETVHLINAYTPAGFEYTIFPTAVPATAKALPPAGLPPVDMQQAAIDIAGVGKKYPASVTTAFSRDFLNLGEISKEFKK